MSPEGTLPENIKSLMTVVYIWDGTSTSITITVAAKEKAGTKKNADTYISSLLISELQGEIIGHITTAAELRFI